MGIVRFLGWALVLVGVVLFARDVAAALRDHGNLAPISFGVFMERYGDPRDLGTVMHLAERYVVRPLAVLLLAAWAFAVFLAFGLVLLLATRVAISGRRRRR